MKKLLILPLLAISLLFFTACSPEEEIVAENDSALIGEWVIKEMNSQDVLALNMRIDFKSTTYSTDIGDCQEEGNWSTLDGVLTMEVTGHNGNCSGGNSTMNYYVSGGELTLESSEGRLVLVRADSIQIGNDPALVGEWLLSEMDGQNVLLMGIKFVFNSDNTFMSDMGDCQEEGNWSTIEGNITFHSTMQNGDCGNDGGNPTIPYSVVGDSLTLMTDQGNMVFVKASTVDFGQDEALIGTWTYQSIAFGSEQQDVSSFGITLTFTVDGYSDDGFDCAQDGTWVTVDGTVGFTPETQSGTDCNSSDIGETQPWSYNISGNTLNLSITDPDSGDTVVKTLAISE